MSLLLHIGHWLFLTGTRVERGWSGNRWSSVGIESFSLYREYINNQEQNVDRNMDIKIHSDMVSDRNEEYTVGQW